LDKLQNLKRFRQYSYEFRYMILNSSNYEEFIKQYIDYYIRMTGDSSFQF
jgi:hypothetical protein